jgi:hypothetical protein
MGYVYVLSNPSYPGLVKIGMTNIDINERVNQLNTTGVPTPFQIEYYAICEDAYYVESMTHRALKDYRRSSKREFFEVSPEDAIGCVIDLGGRVTSGLFATEEKKLPSFEMLRRWDRKKNKKNETELKKEYKKVKCEINECLLGFDLSFDSFKRLKDYPKSLIVIELIISEIHHIAEIEGYAFTRTDYVDYVVINLEGKNDIALTLAKSTEGFEASINSSESTLLIDPFNIYTDSPERVIKNKHELLSLLR